MESAQPPEGTDRMTVIERWTMYRKTDDGTAYVVDGPISENPERDGYVRVEVSPTEQLTGAVSLTNEQWDRVLGWLHMPVPPGPAKALDESIIRAINAQRGQ